MTGGGRPLLVLGIETATLLGGVALVGPEGVLGERLLDVRATYAERLLPAVESLLAETNRAVRDLTMIAVSLGPGSFTGLRIGLATAQGLAVASGCALAGVGTLEALAWNLWGATAPVVPVLDARRGEVYGAAYRVDGGDIVELMNPQAKSPDDFMREVKELAMRESATSVILTGPGAPLLPPLFPLRLAPRHLSFPRPSAVAELALRRGAAATRVPEELAPLYLRPPATRGPA